MNFIDKNKILSFYFIFSLITIGFTSILSYEGIIDTGGAKAATIIYVGGSGPGNYTKIQDAIDKADPGDTVRVYSGTYNENVRINKTISLIGNGTSKTTINGGISGDVVQGLVNRWTEDVIKEKPDWVSIAIGINDVSHNQLSGRKLVDSLKSFEDSYRTILERTRNETDAKIIMLEIFYIKEEDRARNNLKIDQYNKIIHNLASEYSAVLVQVQSAFREAKKIRPKQSRTVGDGVHPLPIGHTLIAQTFLDSMEF